MNTLVAHLVRPCLNRLAVLVVLGVALINPGAHAGEPERRTLPSGLQIHLYPDEGDDPSVQIWLQIGSGSIAESDDQRGAAIVLKRASALGTPQFDEPQISELFAGAGFDSSIGQGAFTHFDQTTYMLSASDPETQRTVLRYYQSLFSEHRIDRPAFERAKGAVRALRVNQPIAVMESWIPDLLGELPTGRRLPVPTEPEAFDRLTLDAVNRYADEHYTVHNSAIVVVGNFETNQMLAEILDVFQGFFPEPPAPQEPGEPERVRGRTSVASSQSERTEVALLWFDPSSFRETPKDRCAERMVEETVAGELVRHRINALVRRSLDGVEETDGSIVNLHSGLRAGQIVAAITNDEWEPALAELCGQVNRLMRDPISDNEFEHARRACLLQWRAEQDEWMMLDSRERASACNWLIASRIYTDPARWGERASSVLDATTNDEILTALRRVFDPSNANALILAPEDRQPGKEQVRIALANHRDTAPGPLDPNWMTASPPPIIAGIPSGGSIGEISHHAPSGVYTAKLTNGITVRQRSMEDPSGLAEICVTLHRTIEDTTLEQAALVGWSTPSTTKHSAADIRRILAEFSMTVSTRQAESYAQLVVRMPEEHIERGIELASVLLSDPQIDAGAFEKWSQDAEHGLDNRTDNLISGSIRSYADETNCAPADTRPCSDAGSLSVDDTRTALQRFARSASIEIAIAGNADADRILDRAGVFFGALPPRASSAATQSPTLIEPSLTPEQTHRRSTTNPKEAGAVVGLIACPASDLPRVRAMIVAAMVLNGRLDELADQGIVPQGGGIRVYFDQAIGGQALLLGAIRGTEPERIADALHDLLARLEDAPISDEELRRYTALIDRSLDPQLASARFWADRLAVLDARGQKIDDIWLIREAYLGLTPESIHDVFAHCAATGHHLRIETVFQK